MDKDKLDALRKKYGEAKGGDIFNPKFKKVAEKLFSGGDNRALPYANPPTLLDAPPATSGVPVPGAKPGSMLSISNEM